MTGCRIAGLWFFLQALFLSSPVLADTAAQLNSTTLDISEMIWHYRYWLTGQGALFLFFLLSGYYFFNLQLKRGIQKRTAELEKVTSEYKDILDLDQNS